MRGIWVAIFAKAKRSRKAELNKEILSAKLKQVQQHIHDWPSLYLKRNHPDELISGEAILGELDGVVDIIGYYLSQVYDANDRSKTYFNRESGGNFGSNKINFKTAQKVENMPH